MHKWLCISLCYVFLASLLGREKTVGNPLVMLCDEDFRLCNGDRSVKGEGETFSAQAASAALIGDELGNGRENFVMRVKELQCDFFSFFLFF